jgi:hypothetical protein
MEYRGTRVPPQTQNDARTLDAGTYDVEELIERRRIGNLFVHDKSAG